MGPGVRPRAHEGLSSSGSQWARKGPRQGGDNTGHQAALGRQHGGHGGHGGLNAAEPLPGVGWPSGRGRVSVGLGRHSIQDCPGRARRAPVCG